MRKKEISILALGASMLIMLSACGTEAKQPDPGQQVEQSSPVELEPLADSTLEPMSGSELEKIFLTAYQLGQQYPVYQDEASNIREEIGMVRTLAYNEGKVLPSDYSTQYREWRAAQQQQEAASSDETATEVGTEEAVDSAGAEQGSEAVATYGFTDCNETVYATSQVNLRGGPSTSYDKVGSLSSGQSVIRTGKGTGTAEGWSRIQLADGSIVYVSSNYLSTTKPVSNSGGSTTSTPSTPTTNSGSNNTSNTAKPSGGKSYYGGFNTYEEYINDLHNKYPDISIEEIKAGFPDQEKIYVDEELAESLANQGLLG